MYRLDLQYFMSDLRLDGVCYHKINTDGVLPGWSKVPVKIDDKGQKIEAIMITRSLAINCTIDLQGHELKLEGLDTVSAQAGWLILEKLNDQDL